MTFVGFSLRFRSGQRHIPELPPARQRTDAGLEGGSSADGWTPSTCLGSAVEAARIVMPFCHQAVNLLDLSRVVRQGPGSPYEGFPLGPCMWGCMKGLHLKLDAHCSEEVGKPIAAVGLPQSQNLERTCSQPREACRYPSGSGILTGAMRHRSMAFTIALFG